MLLLVIVLMMIPHLLRMLIGGVESVVIVESVVVSVVAIVVDVAVISLEVIVVPISIAV